MGYHSVADNMGLSSFV